MRHWGLLGHRWGRLEGPAAGTWVAMHRTSDAGVHILVDLRTPTGASAEVLQDLDQLHSSGSCAAMTARETRLQSGHLAGMCSLCSRV